MMLGTGSAADYRFVINQFKVAKFAAENRQHGLAMKSIGLGVFIAVVAAPKTIIRQTRPNGYQEMKAMGKVTQLGPGE